MIGIEHNVATLISNYGYVGVFFASLIEGNALLILFGIIASSDLLNPFIMGTIFFVVDFITDLITFIIGKHGISSIKKYPITERFSTLIETHLQRLDSQNSSFSATFPKAYAIVKFFAIPYGPIILLLLAGVRNITYTRMLTTFFIIEPIKIILFMSAGYHFGTLIKGHEDALILGIGGFGMFILIGFFVIRFARKKLINEFPDLEGSVR